MASINTHAKRTSVIHAIRNFPKLNSFLFPEGYELLPNISELFELGFAFYDYKMLPKEKIVQRGAFLKSLIKNLLL